MKPIEWTSELETGIQVVDYEHKQLVDLINLLIASKAPDSKVKVTAAEIVHHLEEYVRNHFLVEEEVMRAAGFPGFKEHKAAHDAFARTVLQLRRELDNGTDTVFNAVLHMLTRWLTQHIQSMDRQYIPYVQGIGTRPTKSSAG